MSDDLISRSALKKVLSETKDIFVIACLSNVLDEIDNAPTVTNGTYEQGFRVGAYGRLDEIRPQGKWILKETDCDSGGNNRYECSKCHYSDIHSQSAEVPYCWHCGADMRGGAE